ncbi:tyrosine-type recombinase/integrase [Aminipila terrae]|uniref:Tyrosine-type recombinase/integrase n=1 Tax=Aminipila terrae TaxID=2697030 RepID=A0A6P1MJ78_9FIRM|nr:tyrosine-type recombinase/integrase [Aminipila terrae]QHI73791.1 tyrosine-type recombinase/integrase [Aminipila terrae]
MNSVDPIRSTKDISNFVDYLRGKNERDYILALTGFYSGYRISDILNLKVKDFHNRDYFYFREKKTKKQTKLLINPILKKAANEYIEQNDLEDNDYIFKSQKGYNQPISRQRAYKVLKDAARAVGLQGNFGTHSLRKTMGYHYYQQTKDVVTLKMIFNHSSVDVTLIYIGITQDVMNDKLKGFKLY